VELRSYHVQARLVGAKLETDQDFHIVIADLIRPAQTMIVELLAARCTRGAAPARRAQMARARAAFVRDCRAPGSRSERSRVERHCRGRLLRHGAWPDGRGAERNRADPVLRFAIARCRAAGEPDAAPLALCFAQRVCASVRRSSRRPRALARASRRADVSGSIRVAPIPGRAASASCDSPRLRRQTAVPTDCRPLVPNAACFAEQRCYRQRDALASNCRCHQRQRLARVRRGVAVRGSQRTQAGRLRPPPPAPGRVPAAFAREVAPRSGQKA
jgi:hypothetical protein